MGLKEDKVSAFVSAVQQAQTQVLSDQGGALYDGAFGDGVASVPPSTGGTGGGFSQADIDAAVAAAQGVDAQALAAVQADAQAKLATLQTSLDAMTAQEQLEEQTVKNVQASIDSVQAAFDAVKSVLGSLQPAPAPVPAPVDPGAAPQSASKAKFDKHND